MGNMWSFLQNADPSGRAWAEFRRSMYWIVGAGVLMVAGSLWYLSLYGPLHLHMVIATTAGVFLSVLLGSGLFAAAFFSDKSGHDRNVTASTRGNAPPSNPARLPEGLIPYRRTADFTETSVPAALLADHTTKEGSWGTIVVEEGALAYRVTDPRRPASERRITPQGPAGVIEPTILHHVEPEGRVRFHVQFWRAAGPVSPPK